MNDSQQSLAQGESAPITVEPPQKDDASWFEKIEVITEKKWYMAILLAPHMVVPESVRKSFKGIFKYFPNLHLFRVLAHSPLLRAWAKQNTGPAVPSFDHRQKLWDFIIARLGDQKFTYLEFGCASGEPIRYWISKCTHPDSKFVGFDTFVGMPEDWQTSFTKVKAGAWSQGGEIPQIDDPRVSFEKGTFQESLPGFMAERLPKDGSPLVIVVDSDLYTSALYVLCSMMDELDRAIVLFDEFDNVLDEFRALEDFSASFKLPYKVLATTKFLTQIAIEFEKQE